MSAAARLLQAPPLALAPAPERVLWTVEVKVPGYAQPWQWGGYAASSTEATRVALDELEAQGLGQAAPIVVSVIQVGV